MWGHPEDDAGPRDGAHTTTTATAHPTPTNTDEMIVQQFRPAWFEQLILRMAGISHTVLNSSYAATEATGPLPCLQHGTVLVGHAHPHSHSSTAAAAAVAAAPADCHANHILAYLEQYCSSTNNNTLIIPMDKRAQSHLIVTMITQQMNPALQVLRFQDEHAWQQVYRPQYLQAGRGHAGGGLGSRFQAWSLRVMHYKTYQRWDVNQCQSILLNCYSTLEATLNANSDTGTLLGTTQFTTTDALLWAHLADALCDVHIVTILSNYPLLVTFFQSNFQKYFVDISSDITVTMIGDNVFLHPLEQHRRKATEFTHALELMQSLRPNLHEVLATAKEIRQLQVKPTNKSKDWIDTWRFGGDMTSKTTATTGTKSDDTTEPEAKSEHKWREEHKANDELWISCVVGITTLMFLFGTRK